jgi:hypothetical protein
LEYVDKKTLFAMTAIFPAMTFIGAFFIPEKRQMSQADIDKL